MWRIGFGTDLHRLIAGDGFMLGGARIAAPFGVLAHSDGDVLLHAVTDALLGALGLGDIGDRFPDTAPENRGRASGEFVGAAVALMLERGYRIGNLDATVNLEQPKLGAYKKTIANNLAQLLGAAPELINVKGKTGEKVGAIGRGEAISAEVILLITRDQ